MARPGSVSPDDLPQTVRSAIARDLAALDPYRRRRYGARLSRLMRTAQHEHSARRQGRARRSASDLLAAVLAAGLAVCLAGAAAVDFGQGATLRIALGAAALCAAMIGWDAAANAAAPRRRSTDPMGEADPAEAALALHRAAYAPLRYAVDLPPAQTPPQNSATAR